MKAPLVALAATAAGFAAASAYLYGELNVERVSTQAEVEARSKHEARTKQLHQSVQFATDGKPAQASMLPFSQLQTSRFVSTGSEPPDLAGRVDPVAAPNVAPPPVTAEQMELEARSERAPAPRVFRRLMREREMLKEPSAH